MAQKVRIKLKSFDHTLVDQSAEKIVKTVKEYMFCNYEIQEDELNDAVSIFKGDIPDNYFDGGGWSINDSTVPKQFYDLLRFFVTLPEFQLK